MLYMNEHKQFGTVLFCYLLHKIGACIHVYLVSDSREPQSGALRTAGCRQLV
jgi:hypothetical protein